jgi:hypothetical protein
MSGAQYERVRSESSIEESVAVVGDSGSGVELSSSQFQEVPLTAGGQRLPSAKL